MQKGRKHRYNSKAKSKHVIQKKSDIYCPRAIATYGSPNTVQKRQEEKLPDVTELEAEQLQLMIGPLNMKVRSDQPVKVERRTDLLDRRARTRAVPQAWF